MKMNKIAIIIAILLFSLEPAAIQAGSSPSPDRRLMNDFWTAYWIAHPSASRVDFGVYHFRRDFHLEPVPENFVVNVSADNRYKLYVNGHEVCFGPARGDLANWYYETIDIAPYLKNGENVIAAVVWNFGPDRPWAQFSLQTGFMLQGNTPAEELVNTNANWKVFENTSISPLTDFSHLQTFIVVGPGEQVDGKLYPWNWNQPGYCTDSWENARQLVTGKPRGIGTDIDWVLTPRDIPLMENKHEPIAQVRRSTGINADASVILRGESFTIPANSKVSLLLDNGHLTMGYPSLSVSSGAESKVKLTYAEALFSKEDGSKRHRDMIDGMEIKGIHDVFIPDGGTRTFSPLWYRTYRYLQLDIETAGHPLVINGIHGVYSAYPFGENAAFKTFNPLYDKIWEVGWRTARLCAQETYYDCPYYEQLQYVGDTRVQALVSLYVSGDDKLMRKALNMFDVSRIHEGLTYSRYPSYSPQFIPPYSLVWINMVHDYYMLRDDKEFINSFYSGIRGIIDWHLKYIDKETGLLGATPYWNFVDWTNEWPWDNESRIGGVPSGGMTGHSSILTLRLSYTLNDAAALMNYMGDNLLADKYSALAAELNRSVMKNAWCPGRQMIADTPSRDVFSQHANIMGIIAGAMPPGEATALMDRILDETDMIQATMYFRFYLFMAMMKTGHAGRIADQLHQWEDMLDKGLTTFAEKPDPTRSDCHAWSASPLYFFLSSMAGVLPDEPGFKSVKIEPRPGNLNEFRAVVPHPGGEILVDAEGLNSRTPAFKIILPVNIPGRLIWKGKEYRLTPGENIIRE
jgi:alpha-L-rhamnosidase